MDQLEKTKSAKTSRPRRTSTTRRSLRRVPPHSRPGEARSLGPRRRSMRIRRTARPVHGNRAPRVSPCDPVRRGGPTDVANIALRCRAHNVFESELVFGRWSPADNQPAAPKLAEQRRELGPDRVDGRVLVARIETNTGRRNAPPCAFMTDPAFHTITVRRCVRSGQVSDR